MKKRVAFLIVSTHLGGAERSLLEVLEATGSFLSKEDFFVLTPKSEGPLLEEFSKRGIPFHVLNAPPKLLAATRQKWALSLVRATFVLPSTIRYFFKLVGELKSNDVRVVHTTGIKMHFLGAWAAAFTGAKTLWHLRDIFSIGLTHGILSATARLLRPRIVANSNATARSFGNTRQIRVLYNGVDTDHFRPARERNLRGELGLTPHELIVGICGALAKWKGQKQFVEAATRVLKSRGRATFLIIGDEIYDTMAETGLKRDLEDMIRASGFESSIRIIGFKKDIVAAYNTLDVLVHASLKPEPFGRVVAEGLSCGLPVIASRDGGILEMISDGENGLLFSPGDVNELAAQITRLLRDQELRTRLGRNGRERVIRDFSFQRFQMELKRTLEEIS